MILNKLLIIPLLAQTINYCYIPAGHDTFLETHEISCIIGEVWTPTNYLQY